MRISKQKRHLNRLLLRVLRDLADVDGQLAQLPHMIFVDEISITVIGFVEDDAHDCLSGAHWAVDFSVHLVN